MEGLLQEMATSLRRYISALTVALFMILPQIVMFMPLYATLVGGIWSPKKPKMELCV